MKPLTIAAGLALLALAGCQNGATGVSTYAGSIDSLGKPVASQKTVMKKVGKVRRVNASGDVIYVNKYKRVPVSKARSAYAPKRSAKKSSSAIAKALTKANKKIVQKVKGRSKPKKNVKNLDKLIAKHARANGVPVRLAKAVVKIESNGRVNARGAAGEIGLMQIMPRTARGMGYKGKMKSLYDPNKNLAYGMKYLGEAYSRGGKTTCGAILKYNAGHYAKRWNPTSRKYCARVKKILKKG